MDNAEKLNVQIETLLEFIFNKINITIPLYVSNPNNSIRIYFDTLDESTASQIISAITKTIFSGGNIWVCNLGQQSAKSMIDLGFFAEASPKEIVIPFDLNSSIDTDWFEYDFDSIACVCTDIDNFNFDSYIAHVFNKEFLSNTVMLINNEITVVMHVYDRRGMDIVFLKERGTVCST